jgi:hypothetical protein
MNEKETIAGLLRFRKTSKCRAVSLILCYIGMCSSLLAVEPYKEIGNSGAPINLQPYIVAGRYTVLDFASQYIQTTTPSGGSISTVPELSASTGPLRLRGNTRCRASRTCLSMDRTSA